MLTRVILDDYSTLMSYMQCVQFGEIYDVFHISPSETKFNLLVKIYSPKILLSTVNKGPSRPRT